MDFKIKAFWQDDRFFLSLLVVVVGVASFGLGRLSAAPSGVIPPAAVALSEPVPVVVPSPLRPAPPIAATPDPDAAPSEVVASKSGKRYHYPWCPGAGQIKEANRITFATPALAEAAGYTRAANCPDIQ